MPDPLAGLPPRYPPSATASTGGASNSPGSTSGREPTTRSGRCEGMKFVLPDWFYQGVLDCRLVVTIDPAYFRLTGGIERWLYRVARKHAARQPEGWRFDLRHLHTKSASQARFSDFALDLRRIVTRQPLPGYDLALEHDGDGRALIAMRPILVSGAVDKLGATDLGYRDFGRTPVGTSGAGGLAGIPAFSRVSRRSGRLQLP